MLEAKSSKCNNTLDSRDSVFAFNPRITLEHHNMTGAGVLIVM